MYPVNLISLQFRIVITSLSLPSLILHVCMHFFMFFLVDSAPPIPICSRSRHSI